MSLAVPKSHPRYHSLLQRHLIEEGMKKGLVTITGMIAQGRGEAFDYLLGEKTHSSARKAIRAAAAQLLLAKHPVLSVNGNTTVLCAKDMIKLAKLLDAQIEINIFYPPFKKRKKLIYNYFKRLGFEILGLKQTKKLKGTDSHRKFASEKGFIAADVVFVPLEDGDRTEALKKMGKKVIAIDLSPNSRTAKQADITIVDNAIRALPELLKETRKLEKKPPKQLKTIIKQFNNKRNLREILNFMKRNV